MSSVDTIGRFHGHPALKGKAAVPVPPLQPPSQVDGFQSQGSTLEAPSALATMKMQSVREERPEPRSRWVASAFLGALSLTSAVAGLMGSSASMAGQPAMVQTQNLSQDSLTAQSLQSLPSQSASSLEAQLTVGARTGQQLSSGRMLKVDAYPNLHTRSLQQGQHPQKLIAGAPNFRHVEGTSVYGTAQPTKEGLKSILRELNAGPGQSGKAVQWTTLREEPVIYINGQSLTLRNLQTPFANLEDTGISAQEVESREAQLRQDILQEAQRNGGKMMIHDEQADGQLITRWVEVNETNVQTPRQLFQELQAEGFNVNYARVPISDEKAPENQDFDALVEQLKGLPPGTPMVFNCHAGRGRTTTGMVIGSLLERHATGQRGDGYSVAGKDRFERGEFKNIQELVSQLAQGSSSKEFVDMVIDDASAVQNLRTATAALKEKAARATNPEKAASNLEHGKDYLFRYYKLVAFDAYLQEQAPNFQQNFSEWLSQHPQLDVSRESIELAMNSPAAAPGNVANSAQFA